VSPDGGDGSTEVMWLAAIAIAVTVFWLVRRKRRV
jgi:LPXTG-motif cell wall-anchored protein